MHSTVRYGTSFDDDDEPNTTGSDTARALGMSTEVGILLDDLD